MTKSYAGTAWSWGQNAYGELGNGTWNGSYYELVPVHVQEVNDATNLDGVVEISRGYRHSLALKEDGTVWGWGLGTNARLGCWYTNSRWALQIPDSNDPSGNLQGVIAVSTGQSHNLILKADGTVWAFGYGGSGQLGLGEGNTATQCTPIQVPGLSDIKQIVAFGYSSLALESNGKVWAWGDNFYGQLGDGTRTTRYSPVQIPTLSNIASLSGGGVNSWFFAWAVDADGKAWGWGSNNAGQLGNGQYGNDVTTPAQIPKFSKVIGIAGGAQSTIALKSDGTVWAWGLWPGNGTTSSLSPVQVKYSVQGITYPLAGIKKVAGAFDGGIALAANGTIWNWGPNTAGELGDGTQGIARLTAVQVLNPSNPALPLTGVKDISYGHEGRFSLAILNP